MLISKLSILLLAFVLCFCSWQTSTFALKKSYVVYLGAHSHGPNATVADYDRATTSHHDFLASFLGSKAKAQDAIFYSYQKHINGFAAKLEEEEAMAISKEPGVVSVFLNKAVKLQTTHSWEFLGLERDGGVPKQSLWQRAKFGEDVIIGNLDTGVWPEAESFDDEGMGPIPSRWKGFCQNNTKKGVPCNRKLIGARYFKEGYEADYIAHYHHPMNSSLYSARDTEGHGSHTLSTAGGSFAPGVSIFGLANGTAKGGSPRARVAAYKVCWPRLEDVGECYDSDIMAAFDAAIDDGVDVLSLSLGGSPIDYFEDGIAIGSFHAVMNGISVICAAGNSGPTPSAISNLAPWILTVAASSIDRDFASFVKLGNNKQFKGMSLSPDFLPEKMYPLISSSDAAIATDATAAQLCIQGALDPEKIKGKIVVCLRGGNARVDKGLAVSQAGGVAMILANDEETGNELIADAHFLPATHITYSDGVQVYSYINSTKSPVAYVARPETDLGVKPAPVMAAFSSQGPNPLTPGILKPDITAPGVNILAAVSEYVSPTDIPSDPRRVPYNVYSGTSMATPHVSGVVGLLKALHPDWSTAAIQSAIMTSARSRDNEGKPMTDASFIEATPFNYGGGHIRPNRAMDPGLIYDLTVHDYLNFLCSLGYDSYQMEQFANHKCPSEKMSLLDFNYPSITIPSLRDATVITRRVRNVGPPGTYTARLHPPAGVSACVEPKSLKFEKTGEEKTFKILLSPEYDRIDGYAFGRLIWTDGVRYVRSPIVVSSDW